MLNKTKLLALANAELAANDWWNDLSKKNKRLIRKPILEADLFIPRRESPSW